MSWQRIGVFPTRSANAYAASNASSEALYEALREGRMAPPPRLVRMAQAGLLGRKTGRGFFRYDA